jgi:hypothetical protein
MHPARLEPAIPASEGPQTHALDRAATGIIFKSIFCIKPIKVNLKDVDHSDDLGVDGKIILKLSLHEQDGNM